RRFDHARKLAALVGLAQRVARNATGEAALRAYRQLVEIDITRRLLDPTAQEIEAFRLGRLAADEPEHDAFSLGDETQRREIAGARRVVFKQEVIGAGARERALGDLLVAAVSEVTAFEIAAAHVHADHHVARAGRDRGVERIDVALDQRGGIAAGGRDALADTAIAQQRNRDLV